jgi:hypothetical protein
MLRIKDIAAAVQMTLVHLPLRDQRAPRMNSEAIRHSQFGLGFSVHPKRHWHSLAPRFILLRFHATVGQHSTATD